MESEMQIRTTDTVYSEAQKLTETNAPVRVGKGGEEWFGPLEEPFSHLYVVRFKKHPETPPVDGMIILLADEKGAVLYIAPLPQEEK